MHFSAIKIKSSKYYKTFNPFFLLSVDYDYPLVQTGLKLNLKSFDNFNMIIFNFKLQFWHGLKIRLSKVIQWKCR